MRGLGLSIRPAGEANEPSLSEQFASITDLSARESIHAVMLLLIRDSILAALKRDEAAEQSPQHMFDIKSSLDAAQIAFETLLVEGDLSPRAKTRLRIAVALRAVAAPPAPFDEAAERKRFLESHRQAWFSDPEGAWVGWLARARLSHGEE